MNRIATSGEGVTRNARREAAASNADDAIIELRLITVTVHSIDVLKHSAPKLDSVSRADPSRSGAKGRALARNDGGWGVDV